MKHLGILLALSLWSIFALIGVAFAADPVVAAAASPAPAALSAFLQGTVFPVIGSLLLGVLSLFLTRLGNKYNIESLTQRNNLIERAAFQGIALAEEKAAQFIRSQRQITGSQKLDIAIDHILSVIPSVAPERAAAITESLLAQIPGIGATKLLAISYTATEPTVAPAQ
jgi:hypothetical protein